MTRNSRDIGNHLSEVRTWSSKGKYGFITDTEFDEETNKLTLDITLPNGDKIKHTVPVRGFWQDSSELQDILAGLDVQPESFEDIEQKGIPVTQEAGGDGYIVDIKRVRNGDRLDKDDHPGRGDPPGDNED